jgi:hypothetical protein
MFSGGCSPHATVAVLSFPKVIHPALSRYSHEQNAERETSLTQSSEILILFHIKKENNVTAANN